MGENREAEFAQYCRGRAQYELFEIDATAYCAAIYVLLCVLLSSLATKTMLIEYSNTICLFNPLISPLNPLLNVLAFLPTRPLLHHTTLHTPKLRLNGAAGLLIHKTIPYTHGNMGIRCASRSSITRLGSGSK